MRPRRWCGPAAPTEWMMQPDPPWRPSRATTRRDICDARAAQRRPRDRSRATDTIDARAADSRRQTVWMPATRGVSSRGSSGRPCRFFVVGTVCSGSRSRQGRCSGRPCHALCVTVDDDGVLRSCHGRCSARPWSRRTPSQRTLRLVQRASSRPTRRVPLLPRRLSLDTREGARARGRATDERRRERDGRRANEPPAEIAARPQRTTSDTHKHAPTRAYEAHLLARETSNTHTHQLSSVRSSPSRARTCATWRARGPRSRCPPGKRGEEHTHAPRTHAHFYLSSPERSTRRARARARESKRRDRTQTTEHTSRLPPGR